MPIVHPSSKEVRNFLELLWRRVKTYEYQLDWYCDEIYDTAQFNVAGMGGIQYSVRMSDWWILAFTDRCSIDWRSDAFCLFSRNKRLMKQIMEILNAHRTEGAYEFFKNV